MEKNKQKTKPLSKENHHHQPFNNENGRTHFKHKYNAIK